MDLIDETIAPENRKEHKLEELELKEHELEEPVFKEYELQELVLQRLFNLEAEASAMILEAQTKAEKKIAEGEKAGSTLFEENYSAKASALDETFRKKILAVRADCQVKLDEYKNKILEKPVDFAAFSALAGKLLLGKT